jgi:ATP-dependent DNA helicase RecG
MREGAQVSFSGKTDQYLGRLMMNNPEWEPLEQQQLSTNRIVPVYPLTAKITQRWLRRQMHQVITYWAPRVPDHLSADIRSSAGLMDLPSALEQVHFPDSWEKLKNARYRLAFDEIFLLQLGVQQQKLTWQERKANVFETSNSWLATQVRGLPYRLTASQQRALKDIRLDLRSGHPMNRLLQGDVGSGKTVVAALGVAMVTRHGAQAAIMAPTSILAEQHYRSMLRFLAREDIEIAGWDGVTMQDHRALTADQIRLMVGATPETEKNEIRQGLANGSIKLVIGTHALIEDPVTFADLEMVIIDEPHRFGEEQRGLLRAKGTNPHLLVMTATPIPRSLALTVYGDLDLTIMDEMPPGRQAVNTFVLTPTERERAYSLIQNQVEAGHQAFIIYPLVEDIEESESKAAVEEHTRLQSDVFPQYKLGLLHGRLNPGEKDEVMSRFHSGEYQILVSTSVVEVGVDVPNATVMLVEGANRFGLAQLHQFRGRVGRGGDKAYCLLIPESSDGLENERLQAMAQTNDGFELAERDLEQRGPGQFLGTRQSGFNELKLASLTDVRLIEKARREAQKLFKNDPGLTQPDHQLLAARLERFWGGSKGDIS